MYTYDRRTASRNLPDFYWGLWQKVREQTLKLERLASQKAMKEAKFQLSNLGLNLDLNKSDINTYRVGSDSWGHDIYMTLTDMWDRGEALDAKTVAMSIFDACGFDPRLSDIKQEGSGKWVVNHSMGG